MNEKGVGLIEVVIVVVIIGIATAIAIPNFQSWLAYQYLRADAVQIEGDLQMARITAINQNSPVTVLFVPATRSYSAFIDDGRGAGGVARDLIQNGTEPTLFTRTINSGDSLAFSAILTGYNCSTNGTGTALLFNSRGLLGFPSAWCVNVTSATVTRTHTIAVTLAGDISVK